MHLWQKLRIIFLAITLARLYPFFAVGYHQCRRSRKNEGFTAYITFKYSLGKYW